MGTVPNNFPPISSLPLGKFLTGSLRNQTANYGPTVFFTAPVTGMYQISALTRIIQSDLAGTIQTTLTAPHSAPFIGGAFPVAVNSDAVTQPRSYWLNKGDTVTLKGTAAGLTQTVFDVYLFAIRVF